MLLPLGPARGWDILQGLGNGDTDLEATRMFKTGIEKEA